MLPVVMYDIVSHVFPSGSVWMLLFGPAAAQQHINPVAPPVLQGGLSRVRQPGWELGPRALLSPAQAFDSRCSSKAWGRAPQTGEGHGPMHNPSLSVILWISKPCALTRPGPLLPPPPLDSTYMT